MTRARTPRPVEVQAAARDPRYLRAIRTTVDGPTWRARARCRDIDPEAFFPPPNDSAEAALRVCRPCQVQSACLITALRMGEVEGIFGRTTPRERRAMLIAWRQRVLAR